MNGFERVCAGLAFLLGIVLLGLGVIGLFADSHAHFTLPPILGALPALVGWGIIRSVRIAWESPPREPPMELEPYGPDDFES